MTKKIKEITDKFENVILETIGFFPYMGLQTVGEIKEISKEDETELILELKKECKEELETNMKELVCSFSNDSDDFATAFVAFINCIIKYNLGDDEKSYIEILYNIIDQVVPVDLNDSEELKQFLKELSVNICENNYDNMIKLYYHYDYSIISLYLFCYFMFRYCFEYQGRRKYDKKLFKSLKNIYCNIKQNSQDIIDYALSIGDYEVNYNDSYCFFFYDIFRPHFFPYCCFRTNNEIAAENIKNTWIIMSEELGISPKDPIDLSDFIDMINKNLTNKPIRKLKLFITKDDGKKFKDRIFAHTYKSKNQFPRKFHELNKIFMKLQCDFAIIIGEIQHLYEKENNFRWESEKIEKNTSIQTRADLLHMPIIVPKINNFNQLLNDNIMLDNRNEELEKAQENRKKILNSFSHRYKNMKTSSLYNVAHALLKMDSKELKKYGRAVLLEYGIKENLKKEVDILQLQFEDNIDKLKEKIQNSTQQQPSQDNFSILEIINNVIKKCIITLVHDGGDESKAIRKFCFKDYDLISIRNSFEENVLFEENMNPVTWFRENIATKFEVNISLFWKEIFFKKHDYADNVISDLLTDILMNCLKYADKTKDIQFDFYDEDNFMIIKSSNTTVKDKTNIPSSGIGLESQNDLLNVLNKAEKKLDNSIAFSETDSIFSIEVRISKNLVRRNENV